MRINDLIYFSPSKLFRDLLNADQKEWINSIEERLDAYYLKPAEAIASKENFQFAALVLAFSAVEYVGSLDFPTINGSGDRFVAWLTAYCPPLAGHSYEIYKAYRCGLVHEGKIKASNLCTIGASDCVTVENHRIIVDAVIATDAIVKSIRDRIKYVAREPSTLKRWVRVMKTAHKEDFRAFSPGTS